MVRVGLVDDDLEHLQRLKNYLREYENNEDIKFYIQEYHNGLNFVEDYDGSLDVVFLDIEMPHMDGLEAAKRIRERDAALGIVFVTNMAQYALKGYEVNAIDFIVKPVGYYVFSDKLKRAISFAEKNAEKFIALEVGDTIVKLRVSQILYIEKDKNYLIYHTDQQEYRVRGTMVAIEEELKREDFSKCINGCLVNLSHVTKNSKDTVWVDDIPLPVSRQRRNEFKEDFMKYIGGLI